MRVVVILLAALAVLVAAGLAYSAWRTAAIEQRYPPVGEFAEIDGRRVHYVDTGRPDGRVVLLVHGASGNLNDQMVALGTRLAADYRVVAVDRPGQGYTERRGAADSDPARQAQVVAGLMDALQLDRVLVVGHSWGGALSLALALDHPARVAGLVLVSPVSHPWPGGVGAYLDLASAPVIGPVFTNVAMMPIAEPLMGAAMEAIFSPQDPPDGYAERIAAPLALRPGAFRANANDVARLKPYLERQSTRYGEIDVPVSIVTGTEDGVLSPRIHSQALARDIDGARLTALPGVGHMPHHAAPEAILGEIRRLAEATSGDGAD